MKIRKIVIIGNSVALRNRPHHISTSKNYGQILEAELNREKSDELFLVNNLSISRAIVYDLHKIYPEIINQFGDYYILNIGSSDAATREVPRWFADFLFSNKRTFFVRLIKGFHAHILKPKRRFLVKLRGKKPWTSPRVFKEEYRKLIRQIKNNTNGKIICLSINSPNERIEQALPGTAKKYREYNQIIEKLCHEFQLTYLDLSDLDCPVHYPDGIHFSEAGNEEVARRILSLIPPLE